MSDHLLQESYQLDSVIFIRLRQINVFQINNQSSTIFRLQYTSIRIISFLADLIEFLDNLTSLGLGIAMDGNYLGL
jgi:hypothetical protein